jgi:hypothetical protein
MIMLIQENILYIQKLGIVCEVYMKIDIYVVLQ